MKSVVDVQSLRVVEADDAAAPAERLHAEVLIVGGGMGGVAAALSAGEAGRTVCLVEETDWLGGQCTSQGVSAFDENRYIESSGGTRTYLAFRRAIRDWYRRNTRLTPEAAANEFLNPGNGWVSRLCFEPRAALAVLDDRLAPLSESGHLRILKRCKAYAVGMEGSRIRHVDVIHLDTGRTHRLTAGFFIDATELGDLLALGAADFVAGAESKDQTAEPHAADTADDEDVQSFTYTFAIDHRPDEQHIIPKPADYEHNVSEQPYSMTLHYKGPRGSIRYGVFQRLQRDSFWRYRRLIDVSQFDDPAYPRDIAMINWPGNDYRGGSILVPSPQQVVAELRAAKDLSLGLLYWLQTDVERDELEGEGHGYPGLKLLPAVMDTPDGLSKHPYIRESRRIRALKTIFEQELITSIQKGPRAAHFPDSVGIGLYSIDLHETKRSRKQVIDPVYPFQIPLGALIPRATANLLAGCKNIGTTHITNGCYRLHPIEWNIGESAGAAAALCIERNCTPKELRDTPDALRTLQRRLAARGVPLMWYDDVPVDDQERFERVHLLPFESPDALERLGENLNAPAL
jgi:hypothetical protein